VETLDAINNRRSIRRFKPDPVEDEKVEKVLEAARQAPSWANTQCWRFIVVRDVNMIHRLADTGFGVGGSMPNRATEAMRVAPVAIVACAELGKAGCSYREPREPVTDKGDWFMFDTALAMQNMVLAATVLGVPEGYKVVSMTPLGYPDEDPKPRPRKELAEIVFHDRFGAK
jgi:nitroreductase